MNSFFLNLVWRPINFLYQIRAPLFHVFISTVGTVFLSCYIWPEMFYERNISFIRWGDYELSYSAAFTLTSALKNHGVHLWNPYDQMPLAFFHLTNGLYTISNMITSFVFLLLNPFMENKGQGFHAVYTYVYFFASVPFKTAGTYLLAKLFTQDKKILLFTTIFGGTVLSSPFLFGLNTQSLFSLFPLVAYLVLRLTDQLDFRSFAFFVFGLALSVSIDPMIGVGYFYLAVHFLLIATLVYMVSKKVLKGSSEYQLRNLIPSKKDIGFGLSILGLCLILFIPYVAQLMVNFSDYAMAQESSRFSKMFSVSSYFELPIYYAQLKNYFVHMIDFENNGWELSWYFVGITVPMLALIGVFTGVDKRRFVIFGTLVLLVLINSPRELLSVSGLPHLLNSATNPFGFLTRSMHMTSAFLTPMLLLILAAIGVDRLLNGKIHQSTKRSIGYLLAVIVFIAIFAIKGVRPSLIYTLAIGATALIAVLGARYFLPEKYFRKSAWALLILIAFVDLYCLGRYYIPPFQQKHFIIPHSVSVDEKAEKQIVDFQNPNVVPYRYHFSGEYIKKIPDPFRSTDPLHMQGMFFRYTNMGKFFKTVTNYTPRHKTYLPLSTDKELQEYVKSNTLFFSKADFAVEHKDGLIGELVHRGLESHVITLNEGFDLTSKDFSFSSVDQRKNPAAPVKTGQFSLDLSGFEKIEHKDFYVYKTTLPENFPKYLSSTVFGPEQNLLQVRLGDQALNPIQGFFSKTFQYDIQNIDTETIQVSVPKSTVVSGQVIHVTYPHPTDNQLTIQKFSPDKFVFGFRSKKPGWVMLHMPFDEKWEVTVNDKPVRTYQANKVFTAFKVGEGSLTIKASYWNNPWIRPMIFLSMMTGLFGLIGLVLREFYWMKTRKKIKH